MERTDAAVNAATDCENDFEVSFLFAIQNVRKNVLLCLFKEMRTVQSWGL